MRRGIKYRIGRIEKRKKKNEVKRKRCGTEKNKKRNEGDKEEGKKYGEKQCKEIR